MESRDKIRRYLNDKLSQYYWNEVAARVQIELLLDIRDLLKELVDKK